MIASELPRASVARSAWRAGLKPAPSSPQGIKQVHQLIDRCRAYREQDDPDKIIDLPTKIGSGFARNAGAPQDRSQKQKHRDQQRNDRNELEHPIRLLIPKFVNDRAAK